MFSPVPEKDNEKEAAEREITKATIDTVQTEEPATNKKDSPQQEPMKGNATAVWNTIKDLHLELILIYHRVCLKLAAMGPDPAVNIPKPYQRNVNSKMVWYLLWLVSVQGWYVEHYV